MDGINRKNGTHGINGRNGMDGLMDAWMDGWVKGRTYAHARERCPPNRPLLWVLASKGEIFRVRRALGFGREILAKMTNSLENSVFFEQPAAHNNRPFKIFTRRKFGIRLFSFAKKATF